MPALPFKLNQDRRHHIPEQKRKVTNWRDYDESLRRRGSLTVWLSDEAVEAWEAERRTSRGGQPRSGPPCETSLPADAVLPWSPEPTGMRESVCPIDPGAPNSIHVRQPSPQSQGK